MVKFRVKRAFHSFLATYGPCKAGDIVEPRPEHVTFFQHSPSVFEEIKEEPAGEEAGSPPGQVGGKSEGTGPSPGEGGGREEKGQGAPVPPESPPPSAHDLVVSTEPFGPPDPELAGWLVAQGFARSPDRPIYVKVVRVGEDTARLVVDFSKSPAKGTRLAYRLDLSKDPPEWKPDQALRDHPDLLAYKRFRDDLLAKREVAKAQPKVGHPAETSAGEGVKLSLLPPEVEVARELEHRDEQMIIEEVKAEIKERVLSEYFYDFVHQGRRVIGLSYAGVKAIIRKMGGIRIDELKLEERKDGWLAICKAHDLRRDLDAIGVAYQPKHFPTGAENPFAPTVAASKATRNCLRQFIEEKVVIEAYREWLRQREKKAEGGDDE